MHYTRDQYNAISNAVCDSDVHLGVAFDMLCNFQETYLEGTNMDQLISDATYRPNMIRSQITSIMTILRMAKIDLDTFISPQSHVVVASLNIARERQEMIAEQQLA